MQLPVKNLLTSILGALLLWAAWPTSPLTLLIFVAWLPLLFLSDRSVSWRHYFGYTYIHMVLWNVLTTWWVAKASVIGGVSAFFANSLIMCVPWLLYYFTTKYVKGFLGSLSIVAYWMAFEYLHHNWDLSWPWLTLGNAFATHPGWIQWYEYTGTSGGSLWVLLSNVLIFHILKLYNQEGRTLRYFRNIAAWLLLLIVPIIFSSFIKNNLTLLHNKYNVVVVQPNIDPYEKFGTGSEQEQLQKLINLSKKEIDANTALVVWPETAIPKQTSEDQLKDDFFLSPLWTFLRENPQVNLLTGLEGYREFPSKVSRFAKPFRGGGGYYEMYNTALMLDSTKAQIYHKSRLVPGVEVLPVFLAFMAPAFEKFGGTGGGYAKDTNTHVFTTSNNSYNVTPAICYESIYGDYLASFNRKGANLVCIITNDGWWGDTQGYKQHMNYARLRAIESRKWVARSANTGISGFIDPFGNIIQQLGWNVDGVLKQTVPAYITDTFYTRHGDLLSKILSGMAAALLLLTIIRKIKTRKLSNM
ncbi:apolipoprotein N-acyltransferase [Niabella sp. 22666]|uniref:apolipoprotein N-acyltransferase n=1 Tax=Niabella sp. 22666 TaxID=3453954 RepID=UPI003F85621F